MKKSKDPYIPLGTIDEEQDIHLINYVEFWQKIDEAKTQGHKGLRKLLTDPNGQNKVNIGDIIPSINLWNHIKEQSENKESYETNHHIPGKLVKGGMFFLGDQITIDRVNMNRETVNNETVFKIILDNVFNGHKLILCILDTLVNSGSESDCPKCFWDKEGSKIQVDRWPMFKRSSKTEFVRNETRLVKDLIEIQNERGDDEHIKKIFQHPAIEILILKQWEDKKMSYFQQVQGFTMFVFLYTFFVRLRIMESNYNGDAASHWIFNRTDTPSWKLIFNNKIENIAIFGALVIGVILYQLMKFSSCLLKWCFAYIYRKTKEQENTIEEETKKQEKREKQEYRNLMVNASNLFGIVFVLFVCLTPDLDNTHFNGWGLKVYLFLLCIQLMLSELQQWIILVLEPAWRKAKTGAQKPGQVHMFSKCLEFLKQVTRQRYWRDPENYMELVFLISVPIAIFIESWEVSATDSDVQKSICRAFVAIGVFAAWIELLIKMGNVSHSVVGDFIKMFYNIIKNKLFAYMQVYFLLITAFNIAFWIILEGQYKSGDDMTIGFWFRQVLTTTMSTGEFNTRDFYGGIKGNEVTQVFMMLFLIGLICLGTIAMLNLLVAAIINDYNKMKDEVEEENLYFIAEYIIEKETFEQYVSNPIRKWIFKFNRNDEEKGKNFKEVEFYCPHFVCNSNCTLDPLPILRPGSFRCDPVIEANRRQPLLKKLLEIVGKNKKLCYSCQSDDNSDLSVARRHSVSGAEFAPRGDNVVGLLARDQAERSSPTEKRWQGEKSPKTKYMLQSEKYQKEEKRWQGEKSPKIKYMLQSEEYLKMDPTIKSKKGLKNGSTIVVKDEILVIDENSEGMPLVQNKLNEGSSLLIEIKIGSQCDAFSLNFLCGEDIDKTICLHINPRMDYNHPIFPLQTSENQTILNTYLDGAWGLEEIQSLAVEKEDGKAETVFMKNMTVQIVVKAGRSVFEIFVNGLKFCTYKYRIRPENITHFKVEGEVQVLKTIYMQAPQNSGSDIVSQIIDDLIALDS